MYQRLPGHPDASGDRCSGHLMPDAPANDDYPEGLKRCRACGAIVNAASGRVVGHGSPYAGDGD